MFMVYSLGLLRNDKFHIQFTACIFHSPLFENQPAELLQETKSVSRKHIVTPPFHNKTRR